MAEQAEIDVLLEALLEACFSVRDAALRVSRTPRSADAAGLGRAGPSSQSSLWFLSGSAGDGVRSAHRQQRVQRPQLAAQALGCQV